MGVYEVFEVLYSPVRAFKKIIEKPDFKGFLLVFVLAIFSALAVEYVAASKFFLETRTPDNENWTESTTFWASNDNITLDLDSEVGNYSVKSYVSNDTSIWMNITDVETLDCSEDTGNKELFFWIKWIAENGSFPSQATLRLFSGNESSSYFELELTNLFASSGEWENYTLKIGSNQGWNSIDSPDWQSVTGLEFRLVWSTSGNLTMKIDGLYFRKYVSPLESGSFEGLIIPILMSSAVTFSMNWILWSLILVIIAKVFREELGVSFTTFFIIIGYVFIVTMVYNLVVAALLSTLPALNLPLRVDDTSVLGYHEMWSPYLAYQVLSYLWIVPEVWTTMLCAVAIRLLRGITWGRAASISVAAFVLRFVLRYFFGI